MKTVCSAVVMFLTAVLLSACGGAATPTPGLSLSLGVLSLTIVQGDSEEVTVNVTRTGGFAGPVTLTLSGLPAGVEAEALTIGADENRGVLSLSASDSATVGGPVGVTATAAGPGGSPADTATLALTVSEAPAAGSFDLGLEPESLSLQQGGSGEVVVTITRNEGFAGEVVVRLVNPPAGIGASPLTIPSGATRGTLSLSASGSATVGTSPLTVEGTSGNFSDTATLSLSVTPAAAGEEFTLALSNAALTLAPGGSAETTVNISRVGGFAGAVNLTLEGDIVGSGASQINGTFTPNPATGGSSTLTISVGSEVVAGEYALTVRGRGGTTDRPVSLSVSVAQAAVLLVDDDSSANNYSPDDPNADLSVSDTRFRQALDALGVNYDVYVVPSNENGPNFDQMQNYQTVIWYTGDQQGFSPNTATISQTDELNLQAYLDQDNRKVIAFSPGYLRPYSDRSWDAISNTFINTYLGATMGRFDFNDNNLTVSGTADTVTAGVTLQVAGSDAIRAYTSVLEPAEGTATLLTTPLDPDGSGTVRAIAIATGRQSVGAAATSTIVFAGFAFENIVDIGPNNKQALMGRLLDY